MFRKRGSVVFRAGSASRQTCRFRQTWLIAGSLAALCPLSSTLAHAQPFAYVGVGDPGATRVDVVDLSLRQVVSSIPVGAPTRIVAAPNGARVYAASFAADVISVIDTASRTVVGSIPFDNVSALAINASGTRLFAGSGATIRAYDTATNTQAGQANVGLAPRAIELSPDGARAYVVNHASNSVSVVNLSTLATITTIPVGRGPLDAGLTPNGRYLYVANSTDDTVSVIDTLALAVIRTVTVGGYPSAVEVLPNGQDAWVANWDDNTFSVIDTTNHAVTFTVRVPFPGTVPVGQFISPTSITFSRDGSRAYVAAYNSRTLALVSTSARAVVSTVAVGYFPIGVAVVSEPGPAPASTQMTRANLASDGRESDPGSGLSPSVSADGRYVAFYTGATRLVAVDTNRQPDVLVRDRATGETTRVSVASDGSQATGTGNIEGSFTPSISGDGRYVAFMSGATNLAPGDGNDPDVFVHDRQTEQTTQVNRASDGTPGSCFFLTTGGPRISAGGRFVVFFSCADNLVPGFGGALSKVFIHDRQNGQTSAVSVTPGGQGGNSDSFTGGDGSVTPDGRYVTFWSGASNLVAGDTNGRSDIFVRDRQTGVTTRVSVATGGVQAVDVGSVIADSRNPVLSADGRYVAFNSSASSLVAGDTNGQYDVFLHDRQTGQTIRISHAPDGSQLYGIVPRPPAMSADGRFVAFVSGRPVGSGGEILLYDRVAGRTEFVSQPLTGTRAPEDEPAISADGRFVAFGSGGSNLVAGDANDNWDVFVRDRQCAFGVAPLSANLPRSIASGQIAITATSGCEWTASSLSPWIVLSSPAAGTGTGIVSFTVSANPGPDGRRGTVRVNGTLVALSQDAPFVDPNDTDADGLPNTWETQFGLDPASSAGTDGSAGDPDGDGVTNAQELAAGTHPRGAFRRYLAEGAFNAFFDVRLALLNVGSSPARVLIRFLQPGGATVTRFETLPTNRRRTLTRPDLTSLTSPDFSTVVESDEPIVLDRTMSWDATGYGSHAETGVASPSTTWYLAEGSTSGDFSLFYLLQNPNPTATTATVRYLRPLGQPPVVRQYGLAPHSRTTIAVDGQGAELANGDVSAVITAPIPVIVERAMYLSRPGQIFAAGHGSAGVTAPATSWFLAEGATGPFFDLFILLANPSAQDAAVRIDYLLLDGRTYAKTYVVPANARFTVWVDNEQIPEASGIRPLDNVAVSSTITSTNGVPIIAERTMWWPSPAVTPAFWTETHNSPGATATATRWALAEGEIGGPQHADTFILIANTSATAGEARVTLYFEDGTSAVRTIGLRPRSRTNVAVSSAFPEATGKRFGSVIESLGASPAQIVVERAMYTSPGGVVWAAGTNALATALP